MKSYITVTCIKLLILVSVFFSISAQSQWEDFTKEQFRIKSDINNIKRPEKFARYDPATLDLFILATMDSFHIPGVQACIVKDDKLIWKGVYGYADIENNRLVTDSTLFLLASVSKTVTGTALMQLWERGLFNLDDDINNFLPFSVRNPNHPNIPITFRMLLTHTSSINDNWDVINSLISWGGDSPIALDSFLVNYLVLPGGTYYYPINYNAWAPGTQWDYCNVAVALIGYLVERISNNSFEQYCQDSIFIPLGMNEASWFLANLDTTHIAMPYSYNGSSYNPYGHYGHPLYPAGWLRTSAIQYSRFLRAYIQMGQFENARILDSSTVDFMTTFQCITTMDWDQGLIFFVYNKKIPNLGNQLFAGHTGGAWGYITVIDFMIGADEQFGVIVFTNGESYEGVCGIWDELYIYGYLLNKIYAQNIEISSPFMKANEDTLILNTEFVNQINHNFTGNAIITSIDSVHINSIALYDDGNHGDSLAGDGIWGNYITPVSTEKEFMVGLQTTDLDSVNSLIQHDLLRFTSIGPVTIDHYEIPDTIPQGFYLKLYLKNNGLQSSAEAVTAEIATTDTNVTNISSNNQIFGIIHPGIIISSNHFFIETNVHPVSLETIDISVNISSNGYLFWKVDTTINLGVGLVNTDAIVPISFELNQNYPNPFNPRTTIQFSIPKTEYVTLKIYNLLGQEVATLVSAKLAPGNYKSNWDASGFASGIYLYKIECGAFIQTRKMILLQ